jgi:hypothetical protein
LVTEGVEEGATGDGGVALGRPPTARRIRRDGRTWYNAVPIIAIPRRRAGDDRTDRASGVPTA